MALHFSCRRVLRRCLTSAARWKGQVAFSGPFRLRLLEERLGRSFPVRAIECSNCPLDGWVRRLFRGRVNRGESQCART